MSLNGIRTKHINLYSSDGSLVITNYPILNKIDFKTSASFGVAGVDTQVQYNNGGVFGADANFTWDKTNHRIIINGIVTQIRMSNEEYTPKIYATSPNGGSGAIKLIGSSDISHYARIRAHPTSGIGFDTGADTPHVMFNETDNEMDLGTSIKRFKNVFLAGYMSDATATATVAECETAYDHSQLTSGNPHNVVYSDVKRSDHIHYTNMLASGIDALITQTNWQDETTTTYANNIVNVRNVTASVMPDLHQTITGTITVNGIDSDGAVIQEVFTFNAPDFELQTGNKQFAILSSIVVDATGAGTGDYFAGIGDKIGVQNYPLNATGDIIKVSKNGAYYDSSNYSVDITNGTINDTANAIQADDFYSIWCRPYK